MAARWSEKNWDRIAQELDSGGESDDGDSLNVLSVQRNARRVAELLHTVLPGGIEPGKPVAPPMGCNAPLTLGAHARAASAASPPSAAAPAAGEGAASASTPP